MTDFQGSCLGQMRLAGIARGTPAGVIASGVCTGLILLGGGEGLAQCVFWSSPRPY